MASSDEVCAALVADATLAARGVRLSALVPNARGLARAIAAGVREVAVFPAVSETFSQRNLNQSVDEALEAAGQVCADARRHGIPVRGYVSTAFGCPYEGDVPVARVIGVCQALLAHGVFELAAQRHHRRRPPRPGPRAAARGAAIPAGQPDRAALPRHARHGPRQRARGARRGHHDVRRVRRRARRLSVRAWRARAISRPKISLYMLHGLGLARDVDLEAVVAASAGIETAVGHDLPSRYYRATQALRGMYRRTPAAWRAEAAGEGGRRTWKSIRTARRAVSR